MLGDRRHGFALILVGLLFIWITNNANRSSTLGMIVGIAIVVLGVVRIWQHRKTPPSP